MAPDEYLVELKEEMIMQGRQLQKGTTVSSDEPAELEQKSGMRLVARPTGPHPTSRNSHRLRELGRSTAIQLLAADQQTDNIINHIHLDPLADAWVMPR